jgi:DNA-binding beta-propeller fold protein YncE
MWENIHPAICHASQAIAEAEKFDDAIFAAFRLVEAEVQERISSKQIGMNLLDEAFDGAKPRIDISDDTRDQKGIKEIFSGALANIRNDRGHKKSPFLPCATLDACLLHLSFASLLIYLLSKDRNTFPKIQSIRVLGLYDHPRVELRGINFLESARVFSGNQEISVVTIKKMLIEALLPVQFSGKLKVVVDGNESNEISCDVEPLKQQVGNHYKIVGVEIPLYKDVDCNHKRQEFVGTLVRVIEVGREYLRIIPTYPGQYRTDCYIAEEFLAETTVGETWYRNPDNGEICYGWTSSILGTPRVIGVAGECRLIGILMLPAQIKTSINESRTLRVIGIYKDNIARQEIDITDKVSWESYDTNIAVVKNGVVFPKRLGKVRIECKLDEFVGSSDVLVENLVKGDKVIYFQGVKLLQQISFDDKDNLYICNQSASIYKIAKAGGFHEVLRIPVDEKSAYAIDCLVVDKHCNIYVNDVSRGICFRCPWDGQKYANLEVIGNVVNGTKKSIIVDSMGNVFIAVMSGVGTGAVVHIDPSGKEVFFPTRDVPIYLAFDPQGNLLIPSRQECAIHIYSRTGELLNVVPHGVSDAECGILVDKAGAIYLPFFYNGRILKITHYESDTQTEWIAEGFQNPGGIAMDSQGHIYVSNFSGNSIDIVY